MLPDPFFDPQAIAQWARAVGIYGVMNTRWGWPIAEIVHFFGLCLLFGAVGMFDLRMLGVARGVTMRHLHRLIPFGLAGFALSVASGFCFVVSAPNQYLYNPALQSKLGLVGLAGVNMVVFYATTSRALAATPADALPPPRARIFAAVSLACWLGAIVCGRVITAYRPPYHWCFWC
ncbi:MAG TPA: hypothetical protein VGO41_07180 [Steroidobacteraceae bacterium]|jgi:hypothetical protein|nr:hypothetical protein [Steroidobacteraceae bacterium]